MYEIPNFDQLVALNESNPKAFESLREKIVDDFIDTAADDRKKRLQGLQFHIDARRNLAKDPLDSCLCISQMMQETFSDMSSSLESFTYSPLGTQAKRTDWKSTNALVDKSSDNILTLKKNH